MLIISASTALPNWRESQIIHRHGYVRQASTACLCNLNMRDEATTQFIKKYFAGLTSKWDWYPWIRWVRAWTRPSWTFLNPDGKESGRTEEPGVLARGEHKSIPEDGEPCWDFRYRWEIYSNYPREKGSIDEHFQLIRDVDHIIEPTVPEEHKSLAKANCSTYEKLAILQNHCKPPEYDLSKRYFELCGGPNRMNDIPDWTYQFNCKVVQLRRQESVMSEGEIVQAYFDAVCRMDFKRVACKSHVLRSSIRGWKKSESLVQVINAYLQFWKRCQELSA